MSDNLDKELMPSNPKIPPKCRECGTEWKELEEESGEYHSVLEPSCNCYEKDIRMSVG